MLKCIIWDLDNTIWTGVLLEDFRVELKEEIVQVIKKAQCKGIIQTICSKNDYKMAMDKLVDFGIADYFVYPQISFQSKSKSIKHFLEDMHFRAEDVIFIDDMEFELNEVKFAIPNIEVKNIVDWKKIDQVIDSAKVRSAEQISKRVQCYRNEEKRLYEKNKYQDVSDFFMQSNFTIHLEQACESDLIRIEELLERSHQLNTTGISYCEEEIRDMLKNREWMIVVGEVQDKYGEYGKSALLIAKIENKELTVKVMIVSCRLLGKGISNYLLFYAYEQAMKNGFNRLNVDYVKNKYNRPMQLLLQMCNFKKKVIKDEKYQFFINVKDGDIIKKTEWIKEI